MRNLAAASVCSMAFGLLMMLPSVGLGQNAKKSTPVLSTWKIDSNHTAAGFKVKHLGIASVRGSFSDVQGEVSTDENDLTKTKVNVEIGINSINTGIEKRDNHLRSPDFFDVAKFPKMKFISTKVYKAKAGNWMMDGNLTIKDVTKPVTLTLEGPTSPIKNPTGNFSSGLSASTRINRHDFGLTWSNVVEGISVVGDMVDIYLEVELLRKEPYKTK